jgi:hypothetical protein
MMDNPFDTPDTSSPFQGGAPAPSNSDNPFAPPQQPAAQPQPQVNAVTNMDSAGDFGFGMGNSGSPAPQPNNGFGGNNGGFNGFGGNSGNSNNFGGNQQNQKKKYKFVQMYHLVNSLLMNGQHLGNESAIMEITYNADYGNVRLTFSNAKADTFTPTSLKIQSADRVTTVNIYPEMAEVILFAINSKQNSNFSIYERVIGGSNSNWVPNQTKININSTTHEVAILTKANNGAQALYTFRGWQVIALMNSLKFLTNGSAYILDIARFLASD